MPFYKIERILKKMKKYLHVNFNRELTDKEKEELRIKFQGYYFNLSEVLKNGFKVLVKFQNSDIEEKIIKEYSKFNCTFKTI